MRENNLNVLRLIGACLVLYGHSYIFLGLREPIFLSWIPMGPLGVFIFFTISGYLIAASWDHDPNLLRFLTRRALRIFPALVVCITLSALVLGPVLTTLPLADYFSNEHTWGYFRNIFLYISYYLPGVFENNRIPNAVNGSLWTLPIEFFMYFAVAIVGVMRGNRWAFAALAILSALVTYFWAQRTSEMLIVYVSDLRQIFFCGTYFWVGAVFYKFDLKRYFSITVVIITCVLMISLEPTTKLLSTSSWILLPILVLAFGLNHSHALNWLTRSGDYSYGIYIYAFPIQQTVVLLYPNMSIELYLPICFSLTLIIASCSWHLVEKPSLKLKPKKANHTQAPSV